MSEGYNSSPRKTEAMKTFAGRSSSLQEQDASPTASPGTIRKKNTFFGSLRYTKKKHKSIEILRSQELIAEENESGRFMDQKEGDAERIRLLKSVKEGRMSIEEAMQQAEELGVQSSYHETSTEETIFNFGIYKYTKNRASCSRRILQFDFQEKVLCTIQKGSRGRKFEFSQIRGYDSEDGVRFDIYFEDYHDYELDADTVEEKNKICTLLESIVQQNKGDEPDGIFEAPVFADKKIIKEGQVEKKGHSAAFMMWPRRWLRVQIGELSYFKIGEEQQSALNIIKLGPGQADVKKTEHNGFIITTSKKEYSFRVIAKDPQSETAERDEWVEAITEGSQPLVTTTQRKSRGSSIFQDPAFTNSIQEQEKYIKDVVKTLQRELEQLTSVLSVVNAPIQATIQVKKVKEVVSKMDTHVKTGLLSWTMRQMKNRSDSSTDLQGTPQIGTLSRQSSTKSTKSQGGPPITPIDEGYETIVVPPARPPKTPDLPRPPKTPDAQQYTYDSIPSRQPVAATIDNSPKCPLSGPTAPQHPRPPSDEPRKDRQVPPYETVNITTPSSYSTSGSPSKHQEPSAIYQQPTSNREAIDSRFEAYDNVNIKNVPVTSPSVPNSSEVDAGSTHEIDAGGMGCPSLDAAVKERKELYTEEDQSGVILLKVTENQGSNEDVSTKEPPIPPLPPGVGPPPPPPPPGIGAPPPPPPIGGGGIMALDSALPAKKAAKPKTKLRPFFWNKVPLQMVTQSMWLGASDRTSQLNLDSLEEMFQMEEKEKEVAPAQAKPTTKMLLDPKKAHNLGIFLSGFKLSAKEIDEKLSLFREEEGALPVDHVIALKRFLPTPEEQEMYKNIKEEDMPGLLQEDKFMIKLCQIPDLDKRLDLLLVVMEFPSQFEELAPAVSNVLDACHKLYSSQRFQVVLEYVLAIGNYINGGTNRGGAYGFRLTTLPKMADIRSGKNKKNTLLKYLLTELQRCCPDALMFLDDLKAVPKAADASIKGLSAEVEVMRKDLQKIKKHSSDLFLKYKRTEAQDVKLVRDVDEFVVEYEEKLKDLSEKCKEMKYIYTKLLMRFGEAANTDSEELFTALSTFVNQVKKTLNEAESGPSDKKRIKLDILNNAIAARMARSQSQDQELASTSTSSEPTENGTPNDSLTDVVDSGQERRPSSDSVEDEEARSSVSELKPQTSPFRTNSPKVIHKKLSVKHSPKESLTLRPTKQGYLDKLSGGKHKAPKWDNRYFELAEGGHLHYYKKAEGKIINTIYLRGCPVIFDEQDSTVIRIKTDDREWSLRAATIDEAKDWKESLDFYAKKTSVSM